MCGQKMAGFVIIMIWPYARTLVAILSDHCCRVLGILSMVFAAGINPGGAVTCIKTKLSWESCSMVDSPGLWGSFSLSILV